MKQPDHLALIQGIYRDKLALYRRHEAGATLVSNYAFNNTYQYILDREAGHLSWLRAAIEALGGTPEEPASALAVPQGGRGDAAGQAVVDDDARTARAFVETWQPAVAGVTNARNRKMLDLMLGEVREHARFFEQAGAGRDDLLGRRPAGAGTGGGVMPTRWIE